MALPPLPENNTARLFITYVTGGISTSQEHTLSIRLSGLGGSANDVMLDLADALGSGTNESELFNGWRVLSAEQQAAGSIVRLPVTVPAALLAILGSGDSTPNPSDQAREVRFVGRGLVQGRRVSFSLYGVNRTSILQEDFRFTPAPGTLLGDVRLLAHNTGIAGAAYVTIGNEPTQWYSYVNWQQNSHWETAQRA
jgi:hypothetical protein